MVVVMIVQFFMGLSIVSPHTTYYQHIPSPKTVH
jgi:hypothetical protein